MVSSIVELCPMDFLMELDSFTIQINHTTKAYFEKVLVILKDALLVLWVGTTKDKFKINRLKDQEFTLMKL